MRLTSSWTCASMHILHACMTGPYLPSHAPPMHPPCATWGSFPTCRMRNLLLSRSMPFPLSLSVTSLGDTWAPALQQTVVWGPV